MKFSFYALGLMILSINANAAGSFNCNGALEVKWSSYYCVGGDFTNKFELKNLNFGTCEGSQSAGEDEPEEIVEIKSAIHKPSLAATSTEWKNAFAYDLTTKEFGSAVLYIKPDAFKSTEYGSVVRLKVTENGKIKDLKLKCGPFN